MITNKAGQQITKANNSLTCCHNYVNKGLRVLYYSCLFLNNLIYIKVEIKSSNTLASEQEHMRLPLRSPMTIFSRFNSSELTKLLARQLQNNLWLYLVDGIHCRQWIIYNFSSTLTLNHKCWKPSSNTNDISPIIAASRFILFTILPEELIFRFRYFNACIIYIVAPSQVSGRVSMSKLFMIIVSLSNRKCSLDFKERTFKWATLKLALRSFSILATFSWLRPGKGWISPLQAINILVGLNEAVQLAE